LSNAAQVADCNKRKNEAFLSQSKRQEAPQLLHVRFIRNKTVENSPFGARFSAISFYVNQLIANFVLKFPNFRYRTRQKWSAWVNFNDISNRPSARPWKPL